VQCKAATFAMMGQLLADTQRDVGGGLAYLQQSLDLLICLKSPDAQVVQEIIDRIRST
jgi:hypothetical protein